MTFGMVRDGPGQQPHPEWARLVTISETRYDWLVDRQPAQARCTCLGDVTGGVEVGMELESTVAAPEIGAVPVPLVDVPAPGTFLGSIPAIDKDHPLSNTVCFVPEEPFELVETPVIEIPIDLRAPPFLYTNAVQIFKSEHRVGGVDYLLGDAVVRINHKPSFSSADLAELPPGGSSAFGLKFSPDVLVSPPNSTDMPCVEEGIIRADGHIHDASVNAKNIDFIGERYIQFFHGYGKEAGLIFPAIRDSGGFNFPPDILFKIVRNNKGSFDSSINSGDGGNSVQEVDGKNPLVVPHSRMWFSGRENPKSGLFKTFTRIVSCTLNQRGLQIGNFFSSLFVSCLMALNFVERLLLKSPPHRNSEGNGVNIHCFKDGLDTPFGEFKFQSHIPNHCHICSSLGYIKGDAGVVKQIVNGIAYTPPGLKTKIPVREDI